MSKPKIAFTLTKRPDTKPLFLFDDDKKESVTYDTLNVYETDVTFIVTPLVLDKLPKLPDLEKYNQQCQAYDKFLQNKHYYSRLNERSRVIMEKRNKEKKKNNTVRYDEVLYKKMKAEHLAILKEFKASIQFLKSLKWNEKAIRRFYNKYGFN